MSTYLHHPLIHDGDQQVEENQGVDNEAHGIEYNRQCRICALREVPRLWCSHSQHQYKCLINAVRNCGESPFYASIANNVCFIPRAGCVLTGGTDTLKVDDVEGYSKGQEYYKGVRKERHCAADHLLNYGQVMTHGFVQLGEEHQGNESKQNVDDVEVYRGLNPRFTDDVKER